MDFTIDEGPILEAVDRLEGKSGDLEEQEAVEMLDGLISQVQSSLGGAETAGRLDLVEMLCRSAERAYLGAAAWVDAKKAESYSLASTYWSVKADYAELEQSLAPRNPRRRPEFSMLVEETPTKAQRQSIRFEAPKTRRGISFTKEQAIAAPSVTSRGQETPPSPEEVFAQLRRRASESDQFKDAVAKKLRSRGEGGFSNKP